MLLLSDMQRNILILIYASFITDIFKFMIHSFDALISISRNFCHYSLITYLIKSIKTLLSYLI